MGEALTIDLSPVEGKPHTFEVGLVARGALPAPVRLTIEELGELDGELSWGQPAHDALQDPVGGLALAETEGLHLYTREWTVPGAHYGRMYRLTYYPADPAEEPVASHEWFSIEAPDEQTSPGAPLTGEGGEQAGKAAKSLGTLHLSVPVSIRLVVAEASPQRTKAGGELLAPFLSKDPSVHAPVKDRAVALVFATKRAKGTKGHDWHVWRLRSDEDGWLYDPDAGKGAGGSIHRFHSPWVRVEGDEVKLFVSFFFAIVDRDEKGIERRIELIKAAAARRDAAPKGDEAARRVFRETVRLLVDSFFDEQGGLPPHAMFEPPRGKDGQPATRVLDEGVSARILFLPVRRLSNARYLELFDLAGDGAALVKAAWNMSEEAVDELLSVNAARWAISEATADAKALIKKAREYFEKHPEALLPEGDDDSGWLGRTTMRKVVDELITALLLSMRKEFLDGAEFDTMPEIVRNAEERVGRCTEALVLALVLGAYDHLRRDVAYPAGEHMLDALLGVYGKVFSKIATDADEHKLAPNGLEELGVLAVNLIVQYYVESRRAKRANSHKADEAFQVAFRGLLLPFGIYDQGDLKKKDADFDNHALRMMMTLDWCARELHHDKDFLTKVVEGREDQAEPLRKQLLKPLAEAAAAAKRQRDQLWTHEFVDIYKQWSLFRDYPPLTGLVHDAYGIQKLDPDDHPNGPGLKKHAKWKDLRGLTFTEFAMHVGGRAMEARDDIPQLIVKVFEVLVTIATPEVMLVGGAKLLYNALTAVGASVWDIALEHGKVQEAYDKAIVGLGSLDDADKASARMKLDAVMKVALEATNLGLEAKGKDALSWPELGQIYDTKLMQQGRRKASAAILHRVVRPSMRKLVGNKKRHRAAADAIGQVIDFTIEHGGKFAYDQMLERLQEDGVLPALGVKELFDAIAIELAMRDQLGVPPGKEIDFKPLARALEELKKAM